MQKLFVDSRSPISSCIKKLNLKALELFVLPKGSFYDFKHFLVYTQKPVLKYIPDISMRQDIEFVKSEYEHDEGENKGANGPRHSLKSFGMIW